MFIIEKIKEVTTIAAASGVDVRGVDDIYIENDCLTVRYKYGYEKEDVKIPCKWNLFILKNKSTLSVKIENIEIEITI